MKSYYKSELEKPFNKTVSPEYARQIQIKSDTGNTKWLSLNDESATELVKVLKQYYNVKED